MGKLSVFYYYFQKQEHSYRRESMQSKICGEFFRTFWIIYYHLIIHNRKKPCNYKDCGKPSMKSHTLLSTNELTLDRNLTNVKSSRLLSCTKNLKGHQRIHSGVKLYKCKECGKDFINYIAHSQHQSIMSVENGKAFPLTSGLNNF